MKPKLCGQCTPLLILGLPLYFITFSYTNKHLIFPSPDTLFFPLLKTAPFSHDNDNYFWHVTKPIEQYSPPPPTNLSHIVFGIVGSEKAWRFRKTYIESWWRPNHTNGYLFLDKPPGPPLLPWPETSPPFRVSDDLTDLLNNKSDIRAQRMVHGIMEVLREVKDHKTLRWVVMGDDDSIFFVDNIVDVLAKYDHTKYYYLGGHSEFILSNYYFSFNQAFGGGGIMLSYPLAKALAGDIESCLKRYVFLNSADNTTKACIADIGVNLTPHQGNHQVDFRGDISGFLSTHPLAPLLSLHHFDMVDPIFPAKDRFQSTRHLMTAAKADQSRMLQQTICYDRRSNWSLSISWGYSAHIYERIMPRSYLIIPIETFTPWLKTLKPPNYMFNTRSRSSADPCEAPHVFFFDSVQETAAIGSGGGIVTSYSRAWPRPLPACLSSANHSADFIQRILVFSPPTKRTSTDRCECCDIIKADGGEAEVIVRECRSNEIIA
ncbi:hypothetical protein ABFX02_04G061600 [Erythranthe guttata]